MSNPEPLAFPTPVGTWRLVNPPADLTAASTAISSACAGWKPVFIEGPVAPTATPEEGVCHAVQDWSTWGMDRSAGDHIVGFAAGLPTGILLCVVAIMTTRGVKTVTRAIVPVIADKLQLLAWSVQRTLRR